MSNDYYLMPKVLQAVILSAVLQYLLLVWGRDFTPHHHLRPTTILTPEDNTPHRFSSCSSLVGRDVGRVTIRPTVLFCCGSLVGRDVVE